ncbi:MAG: helix-turn-helix transcriptional regulator [Gammaproteobacteria bacterium]|jgi:transcriptional regulator with XRE-family HTH domain|nr:helix-turn-helix transcriptional regulator [Candidatus Neomarinimicrobiota bacterium]MBT4329507.1 helix-turn-helix transcriptional regulator [Gammaproteobacteria bacterium]MBT5268075.1 helix-turn-helix transcriptional regulator [Candidatus Neomarinimicrobiota bacterium]MBT7082112.1 helix-turn-helix transcriptional regulator [Chloroflexota bacterium]
MKIDFALAFYRNMRGMSQTRLAKVSGVTSSAISMLEARGRNPSLETAMKLAKALDVTLDQLAGMAPPQSTGDLRSENLQLKQRLKKIQALSA